MQDKPKPFRRPKRRHRRKKVVSSVNEEVFLTLEMLGFNMPSLIEELLSNVSGQRRCPCCGREVRPVITGRKIKHD
jgi:hypothetical protein